MSKERELLVRARDVLRGLKETHYDLYWDIQTALDQPEQEPTNFDLERMKLAVESPEDLREGISLRDHFAGLAMQGMLTKVSTTVGADSVAMAAYHVAHQMLKERSRGLEKGDE
jgi:hypothetical protein